MTSAPSKTLTVKTINNKTGITTSVRTVSSGGSVAVTKTTTIGIAKTVSKPTSTAATASGTALGEKWVTGPNTDGWTMCGPVAIANHLLAVTGIEATNRDIERLYRRAGAIGDSGAPMELFFDAAISDGLAGCRLKDYRTCPFYEHASVALLHIDGMPGQHAAAIASDGTFVLWGDEVEPYLLHGHVLDAWSLTWHGEEI